MSLMANVLVEEEITSGIISNARLIFLPFQICFPRFGETFSTFRTLVNVVLLTVAGLLLLRAKGSSVANLAEQSVKSPVCGMYGGSS